MPIDPAPSAPESSVVHESGCACAACVMRPEPDPDAPPPEPDGRVLSALPTGTLDQLADYLRDGYWVEGGGRAFHWNLTSSGLNPNSGVLLYNVSGYVHSVRSDADGITDDRKELVREAFKLFEATLGIDFEETTSDDPSTVDFFFGDNDSGAYASSGYSFFSGQPGMITRSYINVAESWSGGTSTYDDYTLQTILHEIGHALGLGHQGYYNGSAGYPGDATFSNDSWQASMMSYFAQSENTTVDANYEFLQTPMAVDWMALDDIYGSQSHGGVTFGVQNAFTGDTVWGFNTTITSEVSDIWANFSSYAHRTASTIVDGGGTDTLDFSGYALDQSIDLRASERGATAPHVSDIGGSRGNLTIAEGTVIENAIGGSGADAIRGNAAANHLQGGAGDDTLTGAEGNDTLTGGTGDDVAVFSGNRAAYTVTGTRDSATVSGADGTDTLSGIETLQFDDGTIALPDAPPAVTVGEAGRVTLTQTGPNAWTTVAFAEALTAPSVVVGPISGGDGDPSTVRVRNVTETGFEVQIDEWDYLDGAHPQATLGWLAVEAGTHTLTDGTTLRAGSAVAGGSPVSVSLGDSFDASPVVLAQATTTIGAGAVATRLDGVSSAGFSVRLQAQESAGAAPAAEAVDWIAVEQGGSAGGGLVSLVTGNIVTQAAQAVGFGGSFATAPALLADMQSLRGVDPATVRLSALDTSGASVFVEEEGSADAETAHAAESVGLVAAAAGVLSGQTVAAAPDPIGEARTIEISQPGPGAWTRVDFLQPLDTPEVVMGPLGFAGPDPAAVRVRNVTETGFEVQIDEWDYLDGGHATETISFLAIERGSHTLPDGTVIRAGSASADHGWTEVTHGAMGATPVVLAQIVTWNGPQAATARLRDVTETGFRVTVQEEEGNDGLHAVEEIDWIVIDTGTVTGTGTDRHVALTGDEVTHVEQNVSFGGAFSGDPDAPALLAAMQSFDGSDPSTVRARSVDTEGAMLFVEEERSADPEMGHTTEVIGIAAFDAGLIFA
ncbi:M10 family metallopeptidase C-terminal domain-containing protein [Rhodovulum sp. 12E13]|uniref:M10 family metallopeptidase C-terminal domain-containing protein n=1 Tax=Rhodovulum sp. 12E13 TaxID=2203891 RepID=UPI0013144A39|nr:M10 family metallopeptidase C-terminal domain-containing protein [Rhodovulum sp. 12E13]